jgi:aspartyl-tRNA(Asn)/glutamyl-tRNA(Gln) amidotransferase subunit C
MSISKEEIKHIANLSRLNVSDSELDKYTETLSNIVDMAKEIGMLNTDNVKPTAHILENVNVFRKDEVQASYKREEILKNAPTKESGCISLPKVVE